LKRKRALTRALLLAAGSCVLAFVVLHLYFAAMIAWWASHPPHETAFMAERIETLRVLAYDERAGWLAVRRGEYTLLANFARTPVHVPRERTEEVVLATRAPTLEPGFVVLPALAGALVR